MGARLAGELAEAAEGRGGAVKSVRKFIVWQKLIRRLPIIGSNGCKDDA